MKVPSNAFFSSTLLVVPVPDPPPPPFGGTLLDGERSKGFEDFALLCFVGVDGFGLGEGCWQEEEAERAGEVMGRRGEGCCWLFEDAAEEGRRGVRPEEDVVETGEMGR